MNIHYTFILSLSVIIIGFVFKRAGIITEEYGKNMTKVILNITLPALILKTVTQIDIDMSLSALPLVGIGIAPLMLLPAWLVFKGMAPTDKGVALMCSAGFNIGLFGFPIIEGLMGAEGLKVAAMVDIGNAFILFVVTYAIGFNFSPRGQESRLTAGLIIRLFLTSIPFVSYILGLAINLAGISIPPIGIDILDVMGRANMALVLLSLGIMLDFNFDRSHWAIILKVIAIRYSAGILLAALIFFFSPLPLAYRTTISLCLIMPIGMASVPFSVEFEYEPRIAVTITNLMIIMSFFMMWGLMIMVKGLF